MVWSIDRQNVKHCLNHLETTHSSRYLSIYDLVTRTHSTTGGKHFGTGIRILYCGTFIGKIYLIGRAEEKFNFKRQNLNIPKAFLCSLQIIC
jgi:hypothetical protein